ncbi:MAG: hypothetical protein FWD45_04765 [Coriobacteriia bacterium]|nr:hypothetical protein [Coriobacteriia bacterium]
MRRKTKFLSVAVSVAAAMTLCFGLVGQAFAANTDVEITFCADADGVSTVIQEAIDDSVGGDTVTVTGNIDLGDIDFGVEITIPAGITVIWQAELTGDITGWLLELKGLGSFQMDSGLIEATSDIGTTALGSGDGAVTMVINGGLIKAIAPECDGIYNSDGVVIISGGTVHVIGGEGSYAEANAIWIDDGEVRVTSGTITADGDHASAVVARYFGGIDITGGTLSTSGYDCCTLYVSRGLARIAGGSVSATGVDSYAICIDGDGGAAVYLAGTVTGDLLVPYFDEYYCFGVIIEASVWNINPADIGTKNNLTVKAIGDGTDPDTFDLSEFDFYWEAVDAHSVCIVLENVLTQLPDFNFGTSFDVPWGGYRTGEPAKPTTPGTGDMAIWLTAGAFILLAAGSGSLLVYRRRQASL